MRPKIEKRVIARKKAKVTRGYRLKPSTHALILKIQKILKSDQDEAVAWACSMFCAELRKSEALSKQNDN